MILFLDKKYDPDNCPITDFKHPNRLIRLYLPECLKAVGDKASLLTVLKPLVFRDKKKLSGTVPKWKNEIDSLKLSESTNKTLIELLGNAILSRFPDRRTIPVHLQEHIAEGKEVPGIFLIRSKAAIAQMSDDLLIIRQTSEADEYRNQIRYLPL